jgi:hypothetical protein
MNVRAKFKVTKVELSEGGAAVELTPVTGGSSENEKFYKYTPGGSITLRTINREAAAQFEPGREMYVDFVSADPAKANQ